MENLKSRIREFENTFVANVTECSKIEKILIDKFYKYKTIIQ